MRILEIINKIKVLPEKFQKPNMKVIKVIYFIVVETKQSNSLL